MSKVAFQRVLEKIYKSLNKEQKRAVDTIEGPVMVIAGPGTGKTTILTLRIANILRSTDTPASGILALTFTESGVKSIKIKLREIIGEEAHEVRVHTFHSFASSVISEFPEHFPHLSRSSQITDIEANQLVREIIKEKKYYKLRPLGDPDYYLAKIISAIGDAKKEANSPDTVEKFAREEIERIKNNPSSISQRGTSKGELKAESQKRIDKCQKTILFSEVYTEYEKRKKEEYKMDFDDLLYELLLALKNDNLLLRLLQEKFLYILVDEHQDTNDSQNLVVSLLASFFENPNIFVVGDEKQAIYRFQGASVENFLKFQNLWKDIKIISLKDNYRSHQRILDATFSMIERNYDKDEHKKLRVKLSSGSKHKDRPIDLVSSPDASSSDHYLIAELAKIAKEDPGSTTAVIVRRNKDVDYILRLCQANSLSVSAERGISIFSHPLGLMFFKILEYVQNPSDLESLALSVSSGLWGLDFQESNLVLKAIKSGNLNEVSKKIPDLTRVKEASFNLDIISYLIFIGEISGLVIDSRMMDPVSAEVWRAIINLAKDIAENLNVDDPTSIVKELISYKKTSERKIIKIKTGQTESSIQIMTAHSSKGLEFDYVFLPFALEEYWMRRKHGSSFILPNEKDDLDDVKDSRRLFYVSLTRAKKHAIILFPLNSDSGEEYIPLRFIDELDQTSVKRVSTPKVSIIPKRVSISLSHRQNELLEYSKRSLMENGLSVTALNHYIECPSKFLYKSILKIPEAPNAISEKGIAMHKAISEVWKSGAKDSKDIKKVMDRVIRSYFDTSFIQKSEREILLEELLTDSGAVSVALKEHFGGSNTVLTDKWLSHDLTRVINKKEIFLTLHGQIDSIVQTDSTAKIFDYKTKEGMSLNAVKGGTKDSDGNYFRQLIFYKILSKANPLFRGKDIETSLVFVKPDSKGRCPTVTVDVNTDDERLVMDKIDELVTDVFSGNFLTSICSDTSCQYCLYKKLIKSIPEAKRQ
ncbi:MAG: ATP-dependent DNA helicase [Minisyncoccia bacterium]